METARGSRCSTNMLDGARLPASVVKVVTVGSLK